MYFAAHARRTTLGISFLPTLSADSVSPLMAAAIILDKKKIISEQYTCLHKRILRRIEGRTWCIVLTLTAVTLFRRPIQLSSRIGSLTRVWDASHTEAAMYIYIFFNYFTKNAVREARLG